MKKLTISIDGIENGSGFLDEDERVLVPLDAFCDLIGAEVKNLDGLEMTAVCRGDLCIPLNAAGAVDTMEVDGAQHLYLDVCADALSLDVSLEGGSAMVSTNGKEFGLGSGDTPPAFTLPDLFSGTPVSSSDYLGRKTVFYMWASW
jgi:hypothetical protein